MLWFDFFFCFWVLICVEVMVWMEKVYIDFEIRLEKWSFVFIVWYFFCYLGLFLEIMIIVGNMCLWRGIKVCMLICGKGMDGLRRLIGLSGGCGSNSVLDIGGLVIGD